MADDGIADECDGNDIDVDEIDEDDYWNPPLPSGLHQSRRETWGGVYDAPDSSSDSEAGGDVNKATIRDGS